MLYVSTGSGSGGSSSSSSWKFNGDGDIIRRWQGPLRPGSLKASPVCIIRGPIIFRRGKWDHIILAFDHIRNR
jgi:hypothetical protein